MMDLREVGLEISHFFYFGGIWWISWSKAIAISKFERD
jgi:hypothetical protein